MQSAPNAGPSPLRTRLTALAAAGVLGLGVAACGGDDDESAGPETAGGGTQPADVEPSEAPSEVTLSELAENAEELAGQQVTVSGEVEDVLTVPGAYRLGAEGETGFGEEGSEGVIVLLTQQATPPQVDAGDLIRVQGTAAVVRTPDLVDEEEFLFEEEEEDAGFLDEFEGQAAIAATQVEQSVPQEPEEEETGGEDEAIE